jgi:hypothetical protein
MTQVINLARRAIDGRLTIEEVNLATKQQVEQDTYLGLGVLFLASSKCSGGVVAAILDKGIDIDGYVEVSKNL